MPDIIMQGNRTFGMEAIVQLFAKDKRCRIISNGLSNVRWSRIFETGRTPASETARTDRLDPVFAHAW